jgi:hypothetical protein
VFEGAAHLPFFADPDRFEEALLRIRDEVVPAR